MRFDWRRLEPPDLREEGWPAFISAELRDRYGEDEARIVGAHAWRRLIGRLREAPGDPANTEDPETLAYCGAQFDLFLQETADAENRRQGTCIFISHQRADTARGVRVACLATHHQIDYWLDVHDPTLAFVNRLQPHDPRRSFLVAAIIEIALLNSTHVIALHTASSRSSKWIPYELGRAKARSITSTNAAGWFAANETVSGCGDYVQLAVMTRNEAHIAYSMCAPAGGKPVAVPIGADCARHQTKELA